MHSKKFLKRLFQPRDFYQLLLDLKQSVKHLGMLRSSRMLDKQFIERIMMAVTQVNGCQFCAYFHSRAALNAGISQGEVTRVLEGEFDDAPDEEIAALYFAQHYAETGGKPDAEALACLNNVYGNEK